MVRIWNDISKRHRIKRVGGLCRTMTVKGFDRQQPQQQEENKEQEDSGLWSTTAIKWVNRRRKRVYDNGKGFWSCIQDRTCNTLADDNYCIKAITSNCCSGLVYLEVFWDQIRSLTSWSSGSDVHTSLFTTLASCLFCFGTLVALGRYARSISRQQKDSGRRQFSSQKSYLEDRTEETDQRQRLRTTFCARSSVKKVEYFLL